MKLALVQQTHMPDGDWYTIEKAEHEHREWMEKIGPGSQALRYSGRISDACVEGMGCEMLRLAEAIEKRGHESFKRCAVDATKARVEFWSPRNSQRRGVVSLAEADELAAEIRRTLGGAQNPESDA